MAAGIGGGWFGNCGDITINGGKITATKGSDPYSVGSGLDGKGDTEITLCSINYTADEDTFTYGLDPNTDGTFNLKIDSQGLYIIDKMSFYGRKCIGLNKDGSYKLGKWVRLGDWDCRPAQATKSKPRTLRETVLHE